MPRFRSIVAGGTAASQNARTAGGLAASLLLGLMACTVAGNALAQHHDHGRPGRPGFDDGPWRRGPVVFDPRYGHNHYYPPMGYGIGVLPVGSVSIVFGGANWFFQSGVWFRPFGGRFVVSLPPVGIVVPMLPSAAASLWIGGQPYYYANNVYYAPAPGGYRVVNPPQEAERARVEAPLPPPKPVPDPVIYPRNGQSAEQMEQDQRECNRWATTQRDAMSDPSIFQRAVAACMDGRGYTVR